MTTKTIEKPAPLDPSKLHTRTEYREWQGRMADYHNAIRDEEKREREMQARAEAAANAPMSDERYDKLARQRQAEQLAKQAARAAELQAEKDAEAAYLESLPEVAVVNERSEHHLLLKLEHWFSKGYRVAEDSVQAFLPGFYLVHLYKPAKKSK